MWGGCKEKHHLESEGLKMREESRQEGYHQRGL